MGHAGPGIIIARDKSARGMKEYTVVRDARAALDLVRATRDSAGVAHFYEHMERDFALARPVEHAHFFPRDLVAELTQ